MLAEQSPAFLGQVASTSVVPVCFYKDMVFRPFMHIVVVVVEVGMAGHYLVDCVVYG